MPGKGRPFQKGQSGNPKGRPKVESELREAIQLRGLELVDRLFDIATDDARPDQVAAIKELLNRGYGKPPESIKLSGDVSLTQKRIILEDARAAADDGTTP